MPSTKKPLAIAVVSGGLDSVTLAYLLQSQGCDLHMVSFNYGQRHARELDCAQACAARLQCAIDIIDLRTMSPLLRGSALTDDIAVPHGHYAAPSMAITIVPNRNAVFLAIAYAAAVSFQAQLVAVGVHSGDHPVYPDCRPQFIDAFAEMQKIAVAGSADPALALLAPFVNKTKAEIVALGATLGVPFDQTWSCYEGGRQHCGQCGTCVERREAFALAHVADPTVYTVAPHHG